MPSHAHVLVINGLAVDPARQGHDVGRQLVAAAADEALSRGAHKVSLRVLAPNVRARRLYEACGFTVEGVLRREFLLSDEYVDDLFMACYLEQSEPPLARRTTCGSGERPHLPLAGASRARRWRKGITHPLPSVSWAWARGTYPCRVP